MNYPFKEFAKVGILRQTGKGYGKKMPKIGLLVPKCHLGIPQLNVNYYK
jgi:hypothetical protein